VLNALILRKLVIKNVDQEGTLVTFLAVRISEGFLLLF
jgi:hypothetical protein